MSKYCDRFFFVAVVVDQCWHQIPAFSARSQPKTLVDKFPGRLISRIVVFCFTTAKHSRDSFEEPQATYAYEINQTLLQIVLPNIEELAFFTGGCLCDDLIRYWCSYKYLF